MNCVQLTSELSGVTTGVDATGGRANSSIALHLA
jgi:hypothetical protein